MMIYAYYFLAALGVAVALGLFVLMIRFSRIGEDKVSNALRVARKRLDKGKPNDALAILYRALRNQGWDYRRFVHLRRSTKTGNIREAESSTIKIARLLRVMPKNNLDWTVEGLYMLAECYERRNEPERQARLYNDLRNFLEDTGSPLTRAEKADMLSRISYDQAMLDLEQKSFRAALHNEVAGYLYRVENLHARGEMKKLANMFPYEPTPMMIKILDALGRRADASQVSQIVADGIVDGGARVDMVRVDRDIDDFFRGRLTQTARQREVAQILYRKVLEKAEEGDKADKPADDDGIIYL